MGMVSTLIDIIRMRALVKNALSVAVSVKDFGADTTGVADSSSAITAAITVATDKVLYFPAGTYLVNFTTTTALSLSGITILGDGAFCTEIHFVPSSTTYRNLCAITGDNVTIKNIKISALPPSTGSASAITIQANANNFALIDCIIDGEVTNSGATLSHTLYGISLPETGTNNSLLFRGNTFTRLTYPFIKTNTATSIQNRVVVESNTFDGNYYNDLGLNTPLGAIDDVIISANAFKNNKSISASLSSQALGVALASVTNFSVNGNIFLNSYTDAIHIEENSLYGSVIGNSGSIDGNGISFNGNNIGGSIRFPQFITISGNSFSKSGTLKESGKHGIRFIWNASLHQPASGIVVTGNSIYGFDSGLYSVLTLNDAAIVKDNYFENCNSGISIIDGALTISENTTKSCTVGISGIAGSYSYDGAFIDGHTFIECTTNIDSTDLPIAVSNPKFIFAEFNHAGGSTSIYKNCVAAGANDRFHGFFEITEYGDSLTAYSIMRDEVTWDGTTFTRTNKFTLQPGAVNTQAARNSSILAVQVFASSAVNNVRVQAKLTGLIAVAV